MGVFLRFICIVLFLSSSSALSQEYSLSGKVIAQDGTPIPFANVVLLSSQDAVVVGAISEDDGSYKFTTVSQGSYKLKVSFVGYEDFISDMITLSRKLIMPDIQLLESQEFLDEVSITARKPIVTRKADRLVFNVENSILSSGSSWDIIQKTPSVIVQNDNLSVRREGAIIYLNDRRVNFSGEDLANLLKGLGAEVIKEVEVIYNPPAKYDAEGGAIINIVTSKAVVLGYKGSVTARGTYSVFPKHYIGTSHFFKGDKINLFFNYGFNPKKDLHQSDNFNNYQNQDGSPLAFWRQDYERTARSNPHSANLILDYDVSDKQKVSIGVTGLYSPNELGDVTTATTVTSPVNDNFSIATNSDLFNEQTNLGFDIGYAIELEKGSINLKGHFTNFNRENNQSLLSIYRDASNSVFRNVSFESNANQDIEIYTAQLDYNTSLGEYTFETGVKVASIDSQSKIDFPSIQNDAVNGLTEAQNDNFLYDENIVAGYFSFSRDWEKWSAKLGLRGEQTNSLGNSIVLNQEVDLNYFELFPTAYIAYTPNDSHSFGFDYSRRLDRPRYQDLNPFAYFLNENNFNRGNSGLLPSFSNRFNFNYTLKGKYFFDLYYRDNGENIVRLSFQDNENQFLRTESQNALASKSWGFDFNHYRSITDNWFFQTYISVFHEEETFVAIESGNVPFTNEVNGLYVYINNSLKLNQDGTLTAEGGLEYISKFISGNYIQDETINVTFGVRKSLWDKRAVISLYANDILREANATLRSQYLNQDNGYFALPETQYFRVGFTYNFGNFKLKDNNRTFNKVERERLENND